MHAGSVALILNPQTGHVSPQFHVVVDDNFSNVSHMRTEIIPPTWEAMRKNATESATEEAFVSAKTWFKELTDILEDPINDPFKVIFDQPALSGSDSKGAANPNLDQDRKGDKSGAADSTIKSKPKSKSVTFTSSLANKGGSLAMTKLANLSESGLC